MAIGYLLKAKLAPVRMRDFKVGKDSPKADDPMYEIGREHWVPFRNLPSSLQPHHDEEPTGDREIAVKVVENIESYPVPEAVNKPPEPEAPAAEPEPKGPPQKAKMSHTVDQEKIDKFHAEERKRKDADAESAGLILDDDDAAPPPPAKDTPKKKGGRRSGK